MAYSENTTALAAAFMQASGFYRGGQKGKIGSEVMQDLNDDEKDEYKWSLPRTDACWAEFFSKVAIRQGRLSYAVALVPVEMTDKNTVAELTNFSPNFARVVKTAQALKQ